MCTQLSAVMYRNLGCGLVLRAECDSQIHAQACCSGQAPPVGQEKHAWETAGSCVCMLASAVQALEVSLPQDAVNLMVGQ